MRSRKTADWKRLTWNALTKYNRPHLLTNKHFSAFQSWPVWGRPFGGLFLMHYYPHHVADYQRDTAHLSMVEHGAYRLLMDRYYESEKPIPDQLEIVFRVLRASSKVERESIRTVLAEFFTLENGCYKHKRIDAEIDLFQIGKETAKRAGKASGEARRAKRDAEQKANGKRTTVERPLNDRSFSVPTESQPTRTKNQEPEPKPDPLNPPRGKPTAPRVETGKDHRHFDVMSQWGERFKAVMGFDYQCAGGRDGSALQRFLPTVKLSADEILAVAEAAWREQQTNKYAKATRLAVTISGMCNGWNAIRAELQHTPVNGNGIKPDGTLVARNGECETDVNINDIREL